MAAFRAACVSRDYFLAVFFLAGFSELGTSLPLPDCEVRSLANFFFGVEDAFLLSAASLFRLLFFLPESFEVPLEELGERIRAVSGFSDNICCVVMLVFEKVATSLEKERKFG